jgi:N6-L-threonylcarbamoyladenine synthase
MKRMKILGIETTCDETSIAVVEDGHKILSNTIYSQSALHSQFGGVVPELACRRHIDVISHVLKKSLEEAGVSLDDIDLIAVAKGPGLIGALLIGIQFAKALAWATKKPLIGINHIEAHLFASVMSHPPPHTFPALGVVLSGGHTSIVLMKSIGTYELLAETVDDAIGEAFDKVAKMLGLGYPGGPLIEELAKQGNPSKYSFKAGKVKGRPLDFSFSGIKTAVLYTIRGKTLASQDICDIAASFQEAVFSDVRIKIEQALQKTNVSCIYLGGGVTRNEALRATLKGLTCYWPENTLCLDNAAMIAGLAFYQWALFPFSSTFSLEPETRLPF